MSSPGKANSSDTLDSSCFLLQNLVALHDVDSASDVSDVLGDEERFIASSKTSSDPTMVFPAWPGSVGYWSLSFLQSRAGLYDKSEPLVRARFRSPFSLHGWCWYFFWRSG